MNPVKYSVVIPTRNRAKYLVAALRAALAADRDDFEVVVSDNSDANGSLATRRVVDELSDSRVRYVRPPDPPLAMSVHWEFALRQAIGEYVLLRGDDDGLLPSTLRLTDQLLAASGQRIVQSNQAIYFWPDVIDPNLQDRLLVTAPPVGLEWQARVQDGWALLRAVGHCRAYYLGLPMLYNSAIHIDYVRRLLTGPSPALPASSPDIYSGLAIAASARWYLSVPYPLDVCGCGAGSNGAAHIFAAERSAVASEFQTLNTSANLGLHPAVPNVPVPFQPVADALYRYRDRYPNDSAVTMNPRAYAVAYIDGVRDLAASPEQRAVYFDRLKCFYAGKPGLLRRIAAARQGQGAGEGANPFDRLGLYQQGLGVDAARFGVADVAEAARLVEKLTAVDRRQFTLAPAARPTVKATTRDWTPPAVYRMAAALRHRLGV